LRQSDENANNEEDDENKSIIEIKTPLPSVVSNDYQDDDLFKYNQIL
jgi:hypothetical protein